MPEHESRGVHDLHGRLADAGASLVEYALMVALIVVALIGAVQFMGDNTEDRYDSRWGSCGGVDQFDDYSGAGVSAACP
jgi:Flp pilus assembly pilin Flp